MQSLVYIDLITSRLNKTDLLHLGLTCRRIWSVAVAKLWDVAEESKLRCLVPEGFDLYSSQISEYPTLIDTVWEGLQYYGQYVKRLDLSDGTTVADTILFVVWETFPRGTLFPRLQELRLELSSDLQIRGALMLLTSSLKVVRITIESISGVIDKELTDEFIENILSCLNITDLEISFPQGSAGWLKIVHRATLARLLRLTKLKSLYLLPVMDPRDLFPIVATLPVLEDLNIEVDCDPGSLSAYRFPPRAFPALKTLHFTWNRSRVLSGPGYNSNLLNAISSLCLQDLLYYCLSARQLSRELDIVAKKFCATLMKLELNVRISDEEVTKAGLSGRTMVMPFVVFQPLLECRRLQHVYIRSERAVEFPSDYWTEQISTSWPRLRFFTILDWVNSYAAKRRRHLPIATRRSLLLLATYCKDLTSFTTSIDFDMRFTTKSTALSAESASLEYLTLRHSCCCDPESVARFLRKTFPRLKNVHCDPEEGMAEVERLMNVPELQNRISG